MDIQQPGLARRIDALLPQTQCTRCGYPDCAAYADAIALEGAPINQCPPGGAEGVARIAALTGSPLLPLNPDHGHEGPRAVAFIDENWCIGCTLCLEACPTDAIVLEKNYELSYTDRAAAILTKTELLVKVPEGGSPTPQKTEPGLYTRSVPEMKDPTD